MTTDEFRAFVTTGWAPRSDAPPARSPAADYAARRRAALSAAYPGQRLVVPAGGLKVRSNDCDYVFRPHTAFAYLSGLGADREPDAVLVLEPNAHGHDAILYFRPLATRDSDEFFGDARYGEFWVGPRPSLADIEAELGLSAAHIDGFLDAATKDAAHVLVRVVRDADHELTGQLDALRVAQGRDQQEAEVADDELAHDISYARMIKDDYEVEQLRAAVAATGDGFEAVIAELPTLNGRGRGERWVEGTFAREARHQGNGVGYDSICAAGDHANTLHWIRNTGDIADDDLILLDAGVEVDALYTADITRTLPVSGSFTPAQREIYDAVYAAQQAGLAAGIDVEASLDTETGQYHRRWMVHGTSHHLGLDVHDCALATRSEYLDAELRPGMVLTVEPGLYFKSDDTLAPERFRGIGVRIEDDVLVTATGHENLSGHLPRSSAEVEKWIARVQGD